MIRLRDGRVLTPADVADLAESLVLVNAFLNVLNGCLDVEGLEALS